MASRTYICCQIWCSIHVLFWLLQSVQKPMTSFLSFKVRDPTCCLAYLSTTCRKSKSGVYFSAYLWRLLSDSVSALIHPISSTRLVFQDGCCIFYTGLTADVHTWVVQRSNGWRRGPWGGGWGRKRRMDERMTRVSHQAHWARSPAKGLMATSVGWALVELRQGTVGCHSVRRWDWRVRGARLGVNQWRRWRSWATV